MRVLVTGHLGYIGTVMVPMLLKSGDEVVGLDSDLYEHCTFAAGGVIADVPHIKKKDVRDATAGDLEGLLEFTKTIWPRRLQPGSGACVCQSICRIEAIPQGQNARRRPLTVWRWRVVCTFSRTKTAQLY